MMLSEHAAEVELTEGRETPKAVNIKTPIAFIQAHKFGGVQSAGRCACDRRVVLLATATVRIIATTTKTAARMNGNNFTNVSPERESIGRNF